VNGSPVSAGTFSVNSEGVLSKTLFTIPSTVLDNATQYVLTVEPNPDTSPKPPSIKPLAGLVPLDAADHALLPMVNQGVNLVSFGSVSR
tara:strand:+ start:1427 stop:1693 length:267 start_codon:yes stop_codon:yes gene_type:complete